MAIRIVHDVRPMRGHTKPRLMRGDDGNYYVVKFQNNPLGRRALINDWVGSRIAWGIGLRVASVEVVQVSDWILGLTTAQEARTVSVGSQFGSLFVADPQQSHIVDYMPQSMFG